MTATPFSIAARIAGLCRQILAPSRFPGPLRYVRRLAAGAVFLPGLLLLQAVHWIGFLLDDVFFRGYRRVAIREPVFVLGAPRSGTTCLHRLLAADERYTTFATWECLFAPSITERKFWSGLAAADRLVGSPVARSLTAAGCTALRWIDDKHPLGLAEPEEDYFCFLPLLCCFILVVPFPEARWVWRMGTFDRDMPAAQRRRLLTWYRRCLQRHLYAHGPDRTLLSKNAAFAGMARSLAREFPDARIVICERDAVEVIASQFNSVTDGLRLFGVPTDDPLFRRRLLDCLDYYYRNLEDLRAELPPERIAAAPMEELAADPAGLVRRLYDRLGLPVTGTLEARLGQLEQHRPHVPAQAPPLSSWGIDMAEVLRRFAAWTRKEEPQT
ncbi:sulfotransferase family protein [Lentisalinibacter sediminis]|uniref:sulfotransferase family protein n=1 Tax=Lentisalinibacter sediminis TaxID=2992237 RepID=UPI0038683AC8